MGQVEPSVWYVRVCVCVCESVSVQLSIDLMTSELDI